MHVCVCVCLSVLYGCDVFVMFTNVHILYYLAAVTDNEGHHHKTLGDCSSLFPWLPAPASFPGFQPQPPSLASSPSFSVFTLQYKRQKLGMWPDSLLTGNKHLLGSWHCLVPSVDSCSPPSIEHGTRLEQDRMVSKASNNGPSEIPLRYLSVPNNWFSYSLYVLNLRE